MTLTRAGGPLSAKRTPPANHEISGPAHRLLWDRFPRRVRGEVAGATVFDTDAGPMLVAVFAADPADAADAVAYFDGLVGSITLE